jgi:hypothetical protein
MVADTVLWSGIDGASGVGLGRQAGDVSDGSGVEGHLHQFGVVKDVKMRNGRMF